MTADDDRRFCSIRSSKKLSVLNCEVLPYLCRISLDLSPIDQHSFNDFNIFAMKMLQQLLVVDFTNLETTISLRSKVQFVSHNFMHARPLSVERCIACLFSA
ncbi:hypothetical protein LOAG_00595 [Loa loa]|uniref:Uncharacterized protein n=1 Tax=Loa loa TaxID=7209 RepID=A0A1S0UB58_LOALO|nr:hypothetical protein LOAG_00595 [Loa loa]EFO27894.1 hypothetical protein LOAG_00595 [Loa loa]